MTKKLRVEHAAKLAWPLLGLLAVIHAMAFVDRFALSTVAGPIKAAFGLSETALGSLQGLAIAIPYAIVVVPIGRLADRWPPRYVMMAGLAIWTIGAFACAFCATGAQLWAARMLIGVGQAAFVPTALTVLGRTFEGGGRAMPISVFVFGSTLGKSLALLASGAILSLPFAAPGLHWLATAPWRAVFILTAAPNLLLMVALGVIPMPSPNLRDAVAIHRPPTNLRTGYLTFAMIAVMPVILIQALASWAPLFYNRFFNLSPRHVAYVLGSIGLIAAPMGDLIGGRLTAAAIRRGVTAGRLILVSVVIAALASIPFCLGVGVNLSLAAYAFIIICLSVAAPAGLTGISLLSPPNRLASSNAAFMGFVTLVGVGLGPAAIGAISDAFFGGPAGLRWSLFTMMLFIPIACAAINFLWEPLWRSSIRKPLVSF